MDATPSLAAHIDHTLLRPDATEAQIRQLCQEAHDHGFATVCVPPCYVALAAGLLDASAVAVGTVIGFPLGYATRGAKFREAELALADGATELDMVMNISAFKSGHDEQVRDEIQDLAELCSLTDATLKVIIETALLDEAEIARAATLCAQAGAHYVKTSTGFASRGVSLEDVRLLHRVLPADVRIKAAGSIRSRAGALALLAAGASRLGSSNSLGLLTDRDEVPAP